MTEKEFNCDIPPPVKYVYSFASNMTGKPDAAAILHKMRRLSKHNIAQ